MTELLDKIQIPKELREATVENVFKYFQKNNIPSETYQLILQGKYFRGLFVFGSGVGKSYSIVALLLNILSRSSATGPTPCYRTNPIEILQSYWASHTLDLKMINVPYLYIDGFDLPLADNIDKVRGVLTNLLYTRKELGRITFIESRKAPSLLFKETNYGDTMFNIIIKSTSAMEFKEDFIQTW